MRRKARASRRDSGAGGLVVGHRVAASLAQAALHDGGIDRRQLAADEQRHRRRPHHEARTFPRAGVLRIESRSAEARHGPRVPGAGIDLDVERLRHAGLSRIGKIVLHLRHGQIVVLLAQQHQDRRAREAALLGDAAIDPGRIEGDVRREPRLARQEGGAQSLESRQVGNLAAEREADDGDAIGVDVGMLGQQPKGLVGLRHGRRPGRGGGSAVDQAAHGHARVGHGREALLAKGLGVPAFIGLLITADRMHDHDGGMAIACRLHRESAGSWRCRRSMPAPRPTGAGGSPCRCRIAPSPSARQPAAPS